MAKTPAKNRVKVPGKMGAPKIELTKKQMGLLAEVEPPYLISDICEKLGISNGTYYRLMKEDEDFSGTVTRLRSRADDLVENSLFKRAVGERVTTFEDKHNPTDGEVDRLEKEVYVPPDTKAINLWLMNRRPAEWRNKVEVEITGSHVDMIERMRKEVIDVIEAEYEDITDGDEAE